MKGSIKRRGKSWRIIVDVGRDESGQRKQQWYSGFQTKKAAEEKLTEILGSLQGGAYVEPTKRTVASFLGEWLPSIAASVRPSTWTAYRILCEAHIIPALGTVALQRLSAAHLNALYAQLLAHGRRNGRGGLSARTVQLCHVVVHKALGDAVKWQILSRNVADSATAPRPQTREPKVWTADDLRAFLGHVEGDRLYGAYLLAATTGLRRGEVLGLRWCDVAPARLSVIQTLISVGGATSFSTPKTAKGRRSVALDTTTIAALRAHRIRQLEERMGLGLGAPSADGLVFADIGGGPLHPKALSDHFARLVKGAGVPRLTLHGLRHTHATLALAAGIHPKVVSERLGHSTIGVTLDLYSHTVPGLEEAAAEKVAALVFGG